MDNEQIAKVVSLLREAATILFQSDYGTDWSKAFGLKDLADEIEKSASDAKGDK